MLPAHAGMVPPGPGLPRRRRGAPRARGDGPFTSVKVSAAATCSPRTRGWSRLLDHVDYTPCVLPAHAGMVPLGRSAGTLSGCAPRARGDGPSPACVEYHIARCSPRTRGWSPEGDGCPAWSPVLPAHAGMVPIRAYTDTAKLCAPRARGDGPWEAETGRTRVLCSPRTRGWSQRATGCGRRSPVLPAHAGMVPWMGCRRCAAGGAPRARGDGPDPRSCTKTSLGCSPRTRGWSHHPRPSNQRSGVLPAHAGMVPQASPRPGRSPRAPRARGDGPDPRSCTKTSLGCSPRTRGWSPAQRRPDRCAPVLPAHAGMVPSAV